MDLIAQPLTADAFAPFGRVLAVPEDQPPTQWINAGTAARYELLPDAQLGAQAGRPVLAVLRAAARTLPMPLLSMERHALGSQSFVPLGAPLRFAVVVAPAGPAPTGAALRAFVSNGRQGVWLAPGTWHHALLALDGGDFLVVERRSHAVDCDESALPPGWRLVLPPA